MHGVDASAARRGNAHDPARYTFRGGWKRGWCWNSSIRCCCPIRCTITFVVSFEIAKGTLDAVAAPAVEMVSRAMVNAFVKRAGATLTPLLPLQPVPSKRVGAAMQPCP